MPASNQMKVVITTVNCYWFFKLLYNHIRNPAS